MRLLPTRTGASLPLGLLTLLELVGSAMSHTWGEEQYRIAPNGTFIGNPGFPRGFLARDDPRFVESSYNWQIPDNGPRPKVILPTDKAVRTDLRVFSKDSYSEQHPMLKVAPGDWVAFTYAENGHVSRQDLSTQNAKPINRGTIYVYGTTHNDFDYNLMDVHLVWTADGKGGDGKGRLIATRNFDDGQCFEAIPGAGDTEGISSYRKAKLNVDSLRCQTDIQIPLDAPVGKPYTVFWVWDWPTISKRGADVPPASYNDTRLSNGGTVTIPEIYTHMADYYVVDPCDPELGEVKGPTCGKSGKATTKNIVNFASQPDPRRAAIKAQMQNHFMVKVPQVDRNVSRATGIMSNIPMARLIGFEAPINSSLPPSDFVMFPALPGTGSESDEPPSPVVSTLPPNAGVSSLPPNAGGGILTVTVTVPETTVFVTETKTATIVESSTPTPSVTGFLTKRRISYPRPSRAG